MNAKKHTALILFIILLALLPAADGVGQKLSPDATISLLTSSPSDHEVYALYGHTAIRIRDKRQHIDDVFNYGIFDFSKPKFIYRFAKGETDYILGVFPFISYMEDYIGRGSEVCEQVLDLTQEEKERIWQALLLNAQLENRVYRYNFFFDNCSTRPATVIEESIGGHIIFDENVEAKTFRDEINACTQGYFWQTFGCDLALGLPTDRAMSFKETFFLPANLQRAFNRAVVERDGETRPLVGKTNILNKGSRIMKKDSPFFAPLVVASLILLAILFFTVKEFHGKKHFRIIDILLFTMAGIAGCVLFFLSFISVHPCTFPNMSLFWLHPLHLFGVLFFSIKKLNQMAFWYHFINFATIFAMLGVWIFIPQHFNIAFIPLITCLLIRSGWAIYRKKVF